MKNKSIVEIEEIFYNDENQIFLKTKCFIKDKPVFKNPIDSTLLNIFEARSSPRAEIVIYSLSDIFAKMIRLNVNFSAEENNRIFVIPLLH